MGFWRHFLVWDPIQWAHSLQLSKDPVFTDKLSAITLLLGCKMAFPGGLRESVPLPRDSSATGALSQLLAGFFGPPCSLILLILPVELDSHSVYPSSFQ